MCILCDETGKDRTFGAAYRPTRADGVVVRTLLTLRRKDRWEAEIEVSAWIGEEYVSENYPELQRKEIVWRQEEKLIREPINYCPNCGRRLSLADASRKEDA